MIGRSVGDPSEDFGEVVEQFRPRLQLRFQASRQIRDTVGSGDETEAVADRSARLPQTGRRQPVRLTRGASEGKPDPRWRFGLA